MKKRTRSHAHDLRAASRLAIEATKNVTDIVEAMHHAIGGFPARILSAPTYAAIRGITHVVGSGIDAALAQLAPLLGESAPGTDREAVRAALNGVIGDYLARTKNPLAIDMRLTPRGRKRARIVVLVHGSSMNDAQWTRGDHDHGLALARSHRVTPVYALYNSGKRIDENGRELAEKIAELASSWPVEIESIAIVAHSMGGLVARSAARHGIEKLDRIITIGTPHFGAPLERAGAIVESALGVTPYSAPLAKLARVRGPGIADLRRGSREKIPAGITLYAIAGGADKMVPTKSALGPAEEMNRVVVPGVNHLDLLSSALVYDALKNYMH
jgi:pimeloyl-ACP methyl ester carboxylesterase